MAHGPAGTRRNTDHAMATRASRLYEWSSSADLRGSPPRPHLNLPWTEQGPLNEERHAVYSFIEQTLTAETRSQSPRWWSCRLKPRVCIPKGLNVGKGKWSCTLGSVRGHFRGGRVPHLDVSAISTVQAEMIQNDLSKDGVYLCLGSAEGRAS